MLNEKVQNALCDQILMELSSSYSYLAMAAFCELQNFTGCAQWLRIQSQEEYKHAMRLHDFLLARNCPVVFKTIEAPRVAYDTIPQVFRQSLDQEMAVTQSIDRLYELAHKEKAFAALVELQWFITEQVEEEKTARDIVAKFEMVKDDPSAMIDLDRELGTRSPEEEAEEEKAT